MTRPTQQVPARLRQHLTAEEEQQLTGYLEQPGASALTLTSPGRWLHAQRGAGPLSYQPLLRLMPAPHHEQRLALVAQLPGELLITAAMSTPAAAPVAAQRPGRLPRLARPDDSGAATLTCAGVAWVTLVRNLVETLHAHGCAVRLLELWRLPDGAGPGQPAWQVRITLGPPTPDPATWDSLEQDLGRYLQQAVRPRSVLDLVGPVMVGPSSSHTAGANRIGRLARGVLLALDHAGLLPQPTQLSVTLIGSFRDTGPGHRTPAALGGGLLGLAADNPRLLELGDPQRLRRQPLELGALRLPFAGFVRGTAADDACHAPCNNVARITVQTAAGERSVTGYSIGGGNVELRYLDQVRLQPVITGKQDLALDPATLQVHAADGAPSAWPVIPALDPCCAAPPADQPLPFNTFEELLAHLGQSGLALLDVALWSERQLGQQDVTGRMGRRWQQMRQAVQRGLAQDSKSRSGLTGGDAAAVQRLLRQRPGLDTLHSRALVYALAVAEHNADGGIIVACPTAGACGILPGVLLAYQEQQRVADEQLVEALLVAGFVGVLLFDDVATAGADFGCQAEVGAGAAITAAALVQLEGGDAEAVVHAFTLALKNSMGLICDPVAGLVEVPCVRRNGLYSSLAISAAVMALAGVRSAISPDEVVLAVREVGLRLHRDYRETAGGGLATTRDGKRAQRRMAAQVRRVFEEE